MQRSTYALAVAVLAGSFVPPAHAQNREHQQMAAELRIVQEQQQQVALALAQIAEALKAINARIDEQGAATRKSLADQELAISRLGTDLNTIRERTQDTDTRIRTLGDEIEAQRTTLAALPGLIAQSITPPPPPVDPSAVPPAGTPGAPVSGAPVSGGVPPATTTPAPTVPPVPAVVAPPPTPTAVGLSPARMLDTAKADYYAGQWSLAISGFESLIRTFPRSESAGEAQFYIGETHFAQNKWPEAIAAYSLVLQNYKTLGSTHEVLYKLGLAFERSGQPDAARDAWNRAIASYPETDGARLSKQGLDRLSRRQP